MQLTPEIKATIREELEWARSVSSPEEAARIDTALTWLDTLAAGEAVPDDVQHASGMLGGIVPGNTVTPEDYESLTAVRKWIRRQVELRRTPALAASKGGP